MTRALPGLVVLASLAGACAHEAAPPAEPSLARGELRINPPESPARDAALRERFGGTCFIERMCGELWGVDCNSAVDGPYYYVRPKGSDYQVLATCGGECLSERGCTSCPPRADGWSCDSFR